MGIFRSANPRLAPVPPYNDILIILRSYLDHTSIIPRSYLDHTCPILVGYLSDTGFILVKRGVPRYYGIRVYNGIIQVLTGLLFYR